MSKVTNALKARGTNAREQWYDAGFRAMVEYHRANNYAFVILTMDGVKFS